MHMMNWRRESWPRSRSHLNYYRFGVQSHHSQLWFNIRSWLFLMYSLRWDLELAHSFVSGKSTAFSADQKETPVTIKPCLEHPAEFSFLSTFQQTRIVRPRYMHNITRHTKSANNFKRMKCFFREIFTRGKDEFAVNACTLKVNT